MRCSIYLPRDAFGLCNVVLLEIYLHSFLASDYRRDFHCTACLSRTVSHFILLLPCCDDSWDDRIFDRTSAILHSAFF